ncbi:MAG: hypothetical protein O3C21_11800 [Verrucomicrobia bacterium]|nr:hypothetical protein [Verrucomicrobiota bacterium]
MMKPFLKASPRQTVPSQSEKAVISALRFGDCALATDTIMDEGSDDPLSRAQVLASIRAAKQLRLPTSDVLRAVRRQIDVD